MAVLVRDFLKRSASDDALAIQDALFAARKNGPAHFDDTPLVVASPVQLIKGDRLLGTGRLGQAPGASGTSIQAASGINLFEFAGLKPDGDTAAITIKGMMLSGGQAQIYAPNGGVWVDLEDITFNGPSVAGIYARNFVQQWFGRKLQFNGGRKGFYYPHESGGGNEILFDKCRFDNIYCDAQQENAWYVSVEHGNSVKWDHLTMVLCAQDAFVLGGTCRAFEFDTVNTEANGTAALDTYSDFKTIANVSGSPARCTWINPWMTMSTELGRVKYSIDASHLYDSAVLGGQLTRPIYDPNKQVQLLGSKQLLTAVA